jgi:hypothetical protein
VFLALAEGRVRSYASLVRGNQGKDCWVVEFGGEGDGVHAILAHQCAHLGVESFRVESPLEHPLNGFFHAWANGWSVVGKRLVKLLDLGATLEGFGGQMRARYARSGCRGERTFSLRVAETGQAARVRLSADGVVVEKGRGAVHVELPELDMVRFLFGMAGPEGVAPLGTEGGFLRAVLPLDFHVWTLEEV